MLNTSKIVTQEFLSPDGTGFDATTDNTDKVRESSIDIDETLKMISNLELSYNDVAIDDDEVLEKKILKLNPLKKKKLYTKNIGKKSISRSLSQSGSHTPPGVVTTPKKKKGAISTKLTSIDRSKLSASISRSTSRKSSSRSNLISSINSLSDYVTPRSNTSLSSVSSMEWDAKNAKKYNTGKTREALFRCTRHGRYKDVKKMLESGINPNITDKFGNTILLISAQNGSKKLVKTALRYNANINHQNHKGNTAMHYAFAFGYKSLAEYILSKGADDKIENEFGLNCHQGIKPKT